MFDKIPLKIAYDCWWIWIFHTKSERKHFIPYVRHIAKYIVTFQTNWQWQLHFYGKYYRNHCIEIIWQVSNEHHQKYLYISEWIKSLNSIFQMNSWKLFKIWNKMGNDSGIIENNLEITVFHFITNQLNIITYKYWWLRLNCLSKLEGRSKVSNPNVFL